MSEFPELNPCSQDINFTTLSETGLKINRQLLEDVISSGFDFQYIQRLENAAAMSAFLSM